MFAITGGFDPKHFCIYVSEWQGDIAPEVFIRLDEIARVLKPVRCSIRGSVDSAGTHFLKLWAIAEVEIECERCLDLFEITVEDRGEVAFASEVKDVSKIEAYISDEIDVVLANEVDNALQLVEDQLLLAMPFSPRCGRASCKPKYSYVSE